MRPLEEKARLHIGDKVCCASALVFITFWVGTNLNSFGQRPSSCMIETTKTEQNRN